MLIFVGTSFEWVFLPAISNSFAYDNLATIKFLFQTSSKWMFAVVYPILLIISISSSKIISLLYGVDYREASLPLIILAFGLSMNMLTGLTGSMLVGSGNTKLNLAAEIIGGISNIAANLI